MPYQYILANLVAQNQGAIGALFLDESGETIDLACADLTPFQLKVVGAYVGIYLRQMERVMQDNDLGTVRVIHIVKDDLHIFALPLPEDYSLALVQTNPSLVGQSRRTLIQAGEQIRRELFV
jgi:predicted regulator of Ras-like GTPase activity (Roadblock/LC7/MglB family)